MNLARRNKLPDSHKCGISQRMTRALSCLALALLVGCASEAPRADSGIPDRDVDPFGRWELCDRCVLGCDAAGSSRCIPYTADGMLPAVGCDLCLPFCGAAWADTPLATCEPSADGFTPMCGPWSGVDVPSCYRDLAR